MMSEEVGKPADPYAVKEFWTEVVRSAADKGKLDKIPTRIARTPKERDTAHKHNQAITRKVFGGFGANYDLIDWHRTPCSCGEGA